MRKQRSWTAGALAMFLCSFPAVHAADFGATALEIEGGDPSAVVRVSGGYPDLRNRERRSTPLRVHLPLGIAPRLSEWLAVGIGSSPPARPTSVTLVRTSEGGVIDRWTLDGPRISAAELVGGQVSDSPIELQIDIEAANVRVGGAGPAAAVPPPRAAVAAQITFPDLTLSTVTIKGLGWKSNLDATRSTGNCNQFEIVAEHRDIKALFDWYRVAVLDWTPRSVPPTKTAKVSLRDARGAISALANLTGVAMTMFEPITEADGRLRVRAAFVCESLTFAADALR